LGEDQIRTWADKIAKDHAAKKASLHAGTVKVAVEEGLNPEQAMRLAEASNIAAYQLDLPNRGDGDIRFEKVDPKAVVKELNAPRQITDPSPADYHQMPPKASHDVSHLRSIPQNVLDEDSLLIKQAEAYRYPATIDKLEALMSKLSTIRDQLICNNAGMSVLELMERSKFAEIVRQQALEDGDTDEIVKCAFAGRPNDKDLLCDLFGESISKLAFKGYLPGIKVGTVLPPEAISKKLKEYSPKVKVELINGSHPLFKSIDTLANMARDKAKNEAGERIVDEKLKKIKKVLIDIAQGRNRPARVGNQRSGANR